MAERLEIFEQPFITPSGKKLEGTEKVVQCPMWLSKVSPKKNCSKCMAKEKVSLKEGYVICKYRERMKK